MRLAIGKRATVLSACITSAGNVSLSLGSGWLGARKKKRLKEKEALSGEVKKAMSHVSRSKTAR